MNDTYFIVKRKKKFKRNRSEKKSWDVYKSGQYLQCFENWTVETTHDGWDNDLNRAHKFFDKDVALRVIYGLEAADRSLRHYRKIRRFKPLPRPKVSIAQFEVVECKISLVGAA